MIGQPLPTHQHLAARGQRAWVTIAVTDRKRDHAGIGPSGPRGAVADRATGLDHFEVDHAGHQGQRWPERHGGARCRIRHHSIQRDAWTHHVQPGFREMQHAPRVRQMAQRHRRADPLEVRARRQKAMQLLGRHRRRRIVGAGEMRIHALDRAPARPDRSFDERCRAFAVHADALHAGVDLQMDHRLAADRFGSLLPPGEACRSKKRSPPGHG